MLSFFKRDIPVAVVPKSNLEDLISDGKNYFSDELICLDEKLDGNLFSADRVVVEQHGELNGNITSKTCIVTGVVNGNITSLDLLDIKASAVVRGNIQSATVNIEPGAVINGYITVGENIEALNDEWNKTKFSRDDYLTMKLKKELASLNAIHTTTSAQQPAGFKSGVVAAAAPAPQPASTGSLKAAEPKPLVAASSPQQAPVIPDVAAAKPLAAAAAPKPKTDDDANLSRWW